MRFSRVNVIMGDHWMKLVVCVYVVLNIAQLQAHIVNNVSITIVHSAVPKGAVCLDGSPPAYHLDKGSGDAANNWLIFLEGGAWCVYEEDCINRSQMFWGSSDKMSPNKEFNGILNASQQYNPYFYNWNRVYVRYCDGASFTSDVEQVNPKNNLHFRGARILRAVVEDLMEKGMKNATNAILAGSSAGGLAVMLQCDNFRALVPSIPKVKCVSDCGFFVRGANLPEASTKREQPFGMLVDFHGLAGQLPKSCTSKMDPRLCIFPENFAGDIKTPLFIVHSAYDGYQVGNNVQHLEPGWNACFLNNTGCTHSQTKAIMDFGKTLVKALPKHHSPTRGWFIDSCFFHDHITIDNRWNWRPMIKNKTIAQAVGDWYFDRSSFQHLANMRFPYNCTNFPY